jgi:hypothetical protein
MMSERGVPRRRPGWADTDDLGFPVESDPAGFAHAFLAMTRATDVRSCRGSPEREWLGTDDPALPAEGDARDFACAYLAIRDYQHAA